MGLSLLWGLQVETSNTTSWTIDLEHEGGDGVGDPFVIARVQMRDERQQREEPRADGRTSEKRIR